MSGASSEILAPYIERAMAALRALDPELTGRRIARLRDMKNLRLEAWEISAFQALFGERHSAETDASGVLRLFTEAAALRLKIDEEASELSAMPAQSSIPQSVRERVDVSLGLARRMDQTFNDLMADGAVALNSPEMDHLYRSRFRLLRSFSGLWLIYDEHVRNRPAPPRG